ncbi:hypothetical protein LTR36_005831 [Oleoguttula mirabilis]|uniref:Uncharacterized protein n=1 Tax=Oleoguttula mirabilis TaxID=1507867 RepID=A0AAV9JDJ2_9PEZI|nr:hypothetical protein LTR36_005831 [Oleoguttula mirabilis]
MSHALPDEVWQRTFAFTTDIDDTASIWIHGRRVCRAWKYNVEVTYRDIYLRRPERCSIHFDCGEAYIPEAEDADGDGHWHEHGLRCDLAVEMVFDRFVPGHPRGCICRENMTTTGRPAPGVDQSAYDEAKFDAWGRNIMMYVGATEQLHRDGGRFDMPPWCIKMTYGTPKTEQGFEWSFLDPLGKRRGGQDEEKSFDEDDYLDEDEDEESSVQEFVNDTPLPYFYLDFNRREIYFDWVWMFSVFFAEENELAKRIAFAKPLSRKDIAATMGDLFDDPYNAIRTQMMFDSYRTSTQNVEVNSLKIRKEVRRERIRRSYKNRCNYDFNVDHFTADEKEALRRISQLSSEDDDNDDEGDEEDEDEDEDDGVDDELSTDEEEGEDESGDED